MVDENPEVDGYRVESKEQAFEKVKELLGPERFEGPNPPATAEAMSERVEVMTRAVNVEALKPCSEPTMK